MVNFVDLGLVAGTPSRSEHPYAPQGSAGTAVTVLLEQGSMNCNLPETSVETKAEQPESPREANHGPMAHGRLFSTLLIRHCPVWDTGTSGFVLTHKGAQQAWNPNNPPA